MTENAQVEAPDDVETPQSASIDVLDADDVPVVVRCALPGCELPIPGQDESPEGRRRPGRPARYCSKAHADAASRQRAARQALPVDTSLLQLREAAALVGPVAEALAAQLVELATALSGAEASALARVETAEVETLALRESAAQDRQRAEIAEQDRRRAVAAARDDRLARENALTAVEAAEQAAQRTRQEAWARVAEHERERGRAEAAAAAARTTAGEAAATARRLEEDLAAERLAHETTRRMLVEHAGAVERARGETLLAVARAEALDETLQAERQDAARARRAADTAREAAESAARTAAVESATWQARAEAAAAEVERLRAESLTTRHDAEAARAESARLVGEMARLRTETAGPVGPARGEED